VIIRPETLTYLDTVEQFAHRTFQLRDDIAALMELAESRKMSRVFDDILFLAKFVSNARTVISRVGLESEETQKLASELKEQLERTTTLLRTIVKEAPEDLKLNFTTTYLTLGHENMANLFALLYELSWIKNYVLDRGGVSPRERHS